MEKSKVISLRVSESLEDLLKKELEHYDWWNRNSFICRLLENLLLHCDRADLIKILNHYKWSVTKLNISVTEE